MDISLPDEEATLTMVEDPYVLACDGALSGQLSHPAEYSRLGESQLTDQTVVNEPSHCWNDLPAPAVSQLPEEPPTDRIHDAVSSPPKGDTAAEHCQEVLHALEKAFA